MEFALRVCMVLVVLILADATFRMAGGRAVDITDVPHTVALSIPGSSALHCSGVIISPTVILTAAHCVYYTSYSDDKNRVIAVYERFLVRAGSSFFKSGGIVASTTTLAVHPDWLKDQYYCDIAVASLDTKLPFSNTIQAIALPDAGLPVTPGSVGKVSGYGTFSSGRLPQQMQAVDLSIVSYQDCDNLLKKSRTKRYSTLIGKGSFCAGVKNEVKTICPGDSGGPLVVDHVVIGISSFSKCGAKWPSFFSQVSHFRSFIDDFLKNHTKGSA